MTMGRATLRGIWTVAAVLWLASVVAGFTLLGKFDNGAGAPAAAPGQWPTQSRLARAAGRPTLVMLAHPRCTCTRASLAELAELLARAGDRRPDAYVLFIKPSGVGGAWEHTDLWRTAARIPGVTVVRDDDARESDRFGAQTSGQVLLYSADGRLLFSGGTTGARGHAGENAGRTAILALLNDDASREHTSPVFGCPLTGPRDEPVEGAAHADHDAHER